MNFKNYVDCHNHSAFSPDSDAPMEDMIKKAISEKLAVHTITDHCECHDYLGEHYDHNYQISVPQSIKAMQEFKVKYKDSSTKLLTGVELGQPLQNITAAKEILSYDVDFVLGSLHNPSGDVDFYFMDLKNLPIEDVEAIVHRYYLEMLEMCEWGKFDSLGHLTYPLRYIVGECNINLDMTKFDNIIKECFSHIILNQKAIEINTSGLRQKIGTTLPHEKYIQMYHDMGGKYLTIGSDAHCAEDLTKGLKQGLELAYNCGFRHITYFEKRKPCLLEI